MSNKKRMTYCFLHKEECEDEKMIKIIEIKKGKIKQTNVCQNCIKKYIEQSNEYVLESVPDDVNDLINFLIENKEQIKEKQCSDCKKENYDNFNCCKKDNSLENKIEKLKVKMAAAVAIEDYETAAIIKKEIEKIMN